jgi:hypothetical protein
MRRELGREQGSARLHREADPDQRWRRADPGVRSDRKRRASVQDQELGPPQGEFAPIRVNASGCERAARRAHQRGDGCENEG